MSIKLSRRTFVQAIGAVSATAAAGGAQAAPVPSPGSEEFHSILVDTTRCIGCRTCETACAKNKGLPAPKLGPAELESSRTTSDKALTVVNRYATDSGYVYAKNQCMHCNQPACASVCLTKALIKTESGQVIWRGNKCMGCRMCMASCPFDVPKFEYNSWNPAIVKCDLCYDRTTTGKNPVCVDACPAKALMFGTRRELLRIARERIARNPGKYIDHIYGEREAGGTSAIYLSNVEFDQLGMNSGVGNEAYPQYSKPFLSMVPLIFTVLPVLMLGLNRATKKVEEKRDSEELS